MLSLIAAFAVYFLVVFVACFVVVEYGQNYLYDEVTPAAGLKVTAGALLLTALLTWTRSNFATMFTDDIALTVLQAIAWFAVFVLVFRFHPWHGAGLGLATMLLLAGTSTLVVDSMLAPRPRQQLDARITNKPPRRSASGAPVTVKPAEK